MSWDSLVRARHGPSCRRQVAAALGGVFMDHLRQPLEAAERCVGTRARIVIQDGALPLTEASQVPCSAAHRAHLWHHVQQPRHSADAVGHGPSGGRDAVPRCDEPWQEACRHCNVQVLRSYRHALELSPGDAVAYNDLA